MNWLISANPSIYDHTSSFEHYNFIDWRQGNTKYNIGDVVYIYSTTPIKKIRYKCKIEKINLSASETRDDREYWKDEAEYKNLFKGITCG